jgi:UDP:flavonoid glycosyltransferase YjiC (YdhE family)
MSYRAKPSGPRILVSPLHWGLGHATRCIPVIQRLGQRGAQVLLAGSGSSGALLREAFPQLSYHELPAHEVTYARSATGLMWKILQQLPRLARNVEADHQWLERFLKVQALDAVISDNRYGLYHPSLHSVFITHQLEIRTPLGAAGNALLRRYHYRLIDRFDSCWVPDGPAPGLAGALAHPTVLPRIPTSYIGPLSRFTTPAASAKTWDLVILLSGPEPQRTIWEQELLQQLPHFRGSVLMLRGLPQEPEPLHVPPQVQVHAHLPQAEMQAALAGAGLVLARCGYSTVMDLAALRKRSILVPTPGQSEQEYLARHLTKTGFACCIPQKGFDLQAALAAADRFQYRFPETGTGEALDAAVDDLLARVSK